MNDTARKRVTVTLVDEKETASLGDPFASLDQLAGARRAADDVRIKAAQTALAPVVELAAKVRKDVAAIRSAWLTQLYHVQERAWLADVRQNGVPTEMVHRIQHVASNASRFLESVENVLSQIPSRVAALHIEDLEPRSYAVLSWRPAGVFPVGPSRIEADVRLYENAASDAQAMLELVTNILADAVKRYANGTNGHAANGAAPTKILIDGDVADVRRTVPSAVSDFDPLKR